MAHAHRLGFIARADFGVVDPAVRREPGARRYRVLAITVERVSALYRHEPSPDARSLAQKDTVEAALGIAPADLVEPLVAPWSLAARTPIPDDVELLRSHLVIADGDTFGQLRQVGVSGGRDRAAGGGFLLRHFQFLLRHKKCRSSSSDGGSRLICLAADPSRTVGEVRGPCLPAFAVHYVIFSSPILVSSPPRLATGQASNHSCVGAIDCPA